MGHVTLLILLIAVTGAMSQVAPTGTMFNCLREGITCGTGSDGTCDPAAPTTCTCNAGFTQTLDYLCVDDTLAACADASVCINGADCKAVGGTDTCLCDQLHTGTNCEEPRIKIECLTGAMRVTVRPHGTFGGAMYAKTMVDDTTNCHLTDTVTAGVFTKDFAFDPADATNCGVTQSDLLDGGGNPIGKQYDLKVIAQYTTTPNILNARDQELGCTCKFPNDATVTGEIFETVATNNLDAGTGEAEGAPVEFSIIGSDGTTPVAASDVVQVGDDLTIKFLLQTNPVFEAFVINSCSAASSSDNTVANYVTFDFVTGGCPDDVPITRGAMTQTANPAGGGLSLVEFPASAVMIVNGANQQNSLYLSCSVSLCDNTAAAAGTCDAPTCSGLAGFGKRRRRRSAGTETRVVGQTLTVRFGNSTLQEDILEGSDSGRQTTDAETCLTNPALQTIISLLGLFLLLSLLALAVIAFLYCRRSRRQSKEDDMASSTSTLHLSRPRV